MPAYRNTLPYEHSPLRRRASGVVLALCVNLVLALILLTIGTFSPEARKASQALVVDLLPESHSSAAPRATKSVAKTKESARSSSVPLPKPPPIVIPSKPTIAPPAQPKPLPWLEMNKDDYASADLNNLPSGGAGGSGSGSEGDSEEVGRGPHGEVLYAAEWARHPTDAELGGYLPKNAPDGFGLVACKTVPDDRVEDCVELDQTPGSHLASAVRQAAWQFRVRPPRKNGRELVGSWVRIEIDYSRIGG